MLSQRLSPSLARITVYPVKSLPGVAVDERTVLASGALAGDRRFAFHDDAGDVVNGKRFPRIHLIRTQFDLVADVVELWTAEHPQRSRFHFYDDRSALLQWIGDWLGLRVTLAENREAGLPDDPELSGPTVVSTATLEEVGRWFELNVDEVRRRFRANLEIGDVEPFWEDRLLGEVNCEVGFRIGEARWWGSNPCQRCVVPSRGSLTGIAETAFAKRFGERRQATLPDWTPRSRFTHFYRLAVNTRPVERVTSRIQVGDAVALA